MLGRLPKNKVGMRVALRRSMRVGRDTGILVWCQIVCEGPLERSVGANMFESLDDGLVSKRALPLRAFAIRSETQLMEQLRLQPAVPLVGRARARRAGVGADGVHEEPRTAAEGGGCAQVLGRTFAPHSAFLVA